MNKMKDRFIAGEWKVGYSEKNQSFDFSHRSKCRIYGRIKFVAMPPQYRAGEWRIVRIRDSSPWKFCLLDTGGDRQGYLLMKDCGSAVRMEIVHRAGQKYGGILTFEGTATLGKRTFACRTAPSENSRVVQMASGPADSLLNDSLFDIDMDTALQFKARTVKIETKNTGNEFRIFLQAQADDAAGCFFAFDLQEDFYRSRWVPFYRPIDKRHNPSPPTGWMSWNVYFDTAGEKENLEEARVGAEKLKPYGLKIWSIESWQENSDRLPVSDFHNLTLRAHPEKFPHGMKWLAVQIRKLGFIPGIWTVPFGTGDRNFYRSHREWFLHKPDGTPMENWNGRFVLDPSQPRVRKHMETTHRIMSREWGYEYFKIDGMSGLNSGYSAHFFELPEVRRAFRYPCPNAFELCVRALRRGIGKDRIFAGMAHYTGPEVPFCDAPRIGADVVSPNKPPQWHNYLDQARSTLAHLFVNNIIWYNDPDTLLVGEPTPIETARLAATVIALSGQVMFAGDKLANLPDERMRLLQRCLPVCDVVPLDLFPIYGDRPVWVLKIRRPFGSWDVVSLFNWDENNACEIGFTMQEAGLDPDKEYLAYDFWNNKMLGRIKGWLKLKVPPKANALIALHPYLGRPQIVSSDRHLTQGGVELVALKWDKKKNLLKGRINLVANNPAALVVYVPEGFKPEGASCDRADVKLSEMENGRTVKLNLYSKCAARVKWGILFSKNGCQGLGSGRPGA